jgi:hypothetical protein
MRRWALAVSERSVRWRGWRQVSAVRVCRYSGEAQGLKPLMGAAPEGGPAARPGHTSSAHAVSSLTWMGARSHSYKLYKSRVASHARTKSALHYTLSSPHASTLKKVTPRPCADEESVLQTFIIPRISMAVKNHSSAKLRWINCWASNWKRLQYALGRLVTLNRDEGKERVKGESYLKVMCINSPYSETKYQFFLNIIKCLARRQ